MASTTENPEFSAREPVDPELPEKALADLKSLVKGNGIRPDTISLENFDAVILNFEASTIFKIEHIVSEKRTNGRENGEIAGSHNDVQQKIAAYIDRITRDRELHRIVAGLLKRRKDTGFGVNGQFISLKRYNKIFVIHESCSPCNASGKILCQNCHGHRQVPCTKCHGQREIPCHTCAGTQFINTAQGRKPCTLCHGRGRVGCDMCKRTGEIPCPKCKTSGKMPCQNCAATGWHSHIFMIDIRAKGNFIFDAQNLPPEVPPLIESYGPSLAIEEHALVRIIEDIKKEQELDQISKPDEFIIPYHIKLPWGDITFKFGKEEIQTKLMGYNAILIGMPSFLEAPLASGFAQLDIAARAKGNIAAAIRKAIRYRLIGEIFLISGRTPPKHAASIIKNRYLYGFEPETLEHAVTLAHSSLSHLTKKPRLNGFAAGSGLAILIFALYLLGPLRAMLAAALPNLPGIAADLGVLLAGGGIISLAGQLSAGQAVRKALGPLLKKTNKKTSVTPRFSEVALYGFPLAALLFAAVLFAALAAGIAPEWLSLPARR